MDEKLRKLYYYYQKNHPDFVAGMDENGFVQKFSDETKLRKLYYWNQANNNAFVADMDENGFVQKFLPTTSSKPKQQRQYLPTSLIPNPGQDQPELQAFYKGAQPSRAELLKRGRFGGKEEYSDSINQKEADDVAFIGSDADPFKAAMSAQTDVDNRVKKLGGDPDVARAEIETGALNTYIDSASNILTRNKARLTSLYEGRGYKSRDIDNAVEAYALATVQGDTEALAQLQKDQQLIGSDPNFMNAVQAQIKIWEAASIRDNDIPNKYKAFAEREAAKEELQAVADTKSPDFIVGAGWVNRNVSAGLKQFIGRLLSDFPSPGARALGRDIVDFNPKSSDWQGRAFTNKKEVGIGGKIYVIEYADKDGNEVERIRDAKTGLDAKTLTEDNRNDIINAAKALPMESGFNAKALGTQTETAVYDLAPVIVIGAVTGGVGGALARGAQAAGNTARAARITSTARNLGIVAGGTYQVRGDIYDEMLRHGGLTASEAAWHSAAAGTLIGATSLLVGGESRLLTGMMPKIVSKQMGRMANGQITKNQLRWEIAKDVAKVVGGEPIEESVQEIIERGYKKIVDATKSGPNQFEGDLVPDLNEWKEIWAVSAAVGGLMGAGSIRTSRSAYVSHALDQALQKPEAMDAYFEGRESRANAIADDSKREQELDEINRLRSRWEILKANAATIKDLKPDVRARITGLILEGAAAEEELQSSTNPALRKAKTDAITRINKEIEELVTPAPPQQQSPTAPSQPEPAMEWDDDLDDDDSVDDQIGGGIKSLVEVPTGAASTTAFTEGQRVTDQNGQGTIVDVNKNIGGSIHSIEIQYDPPDNGRGVYFEEERMPNRVVVVAGKTASDLGITITQDSDPSKAATGTVNLNEVRAAVEAAEADTETSASATETLTPEIAKAYAKELAAIDADTQQQLSDIDELAELDPDTDYSSDKDKIRADAEARKEQALVQARRNTITGKRDADIKRAKALAQKQGRDPKPIVERIIARYDNQLRDIDADERANPTLHTTGSGNVIRFSDIRALERAQGHDFDADSINSGFGLGADTSARVLDRYRAAQKQMSGADKAKIDLKLRSDENRGDNQKVRRKESSRNNKKTNQRPRTVSGREAGRRDSAHPAQRVRYARSLEIDTNNPRAIALQYVLDNGVSSAIINSLFGGRRRNNQIRDVSGEIKARSGYINNKLGFNKTDAMADAAWQQYGSPNTVDVQDIRNEIEDIISTYTTRGEIADELIADHDLARFESMEMSAEEEAYYAELEGEQEQGVLEAILYQESLTDAEIQQLYDEEQAFLNSPEYRAWVEGNFINEQEPLSLDREAEPETPGLGDAAAVGSGAVPDALGESETRRRVDSAIEASNARASDFRVQGAEEREELEGRGLKKTPPSQRQIRDKKTRAEINDALAEFKKALRDGRNNLTSGGINPEAIAKGAKLVGIYIKAGTYKFADIAADLYAEIGAELKDIFDGLKAAYSAYFNTEATDAEAEQMDVSVRGFSYPGMIESIKGHDSSQELITNLITESTDETEPDAEENDDSEDQTRSTESIIDSSETALSQAEIATTPDEIQNSLRALEQSIQAATSKLGLIISEYNIDDIDHELPNIPIGKAAAKDVRKHAKEIAKLTGWEVDEVYPNIAPAGGQVWVQFSIPDTELKVSLTLNYEPNYTPEGGYDNYVLLGARYDISRQGGVPKKGIDRHLAGNQISPSVNNMSAKDLALALFQAAKPYMANELKVPVNVPVTIENAPDMGPLFAGGSKKSPTLDQSKPKPNEQQQPSSPVSNPALKDVESTAKALEDAIKNNPIDFIEEDGRVRITGGGTELQVEAKKADKIQDVKTPSFLSFLPKTLTLSHLARNEKDKNNIIRRGFDLSQVSIDSPIKGVYFSSEDWSSMDRFGRVKEDAVYVDIDNDGLLYFDSAMSFREYLKDNGLPYMGETLTDGQIQKLKDKGVKGILLREDFASQSRNELIVIDDSIIRNISESPKDVTKLPSSFSDMKSISEAYHKAKADGSNPELVKAVEELLGEPTEAELTEKEIAETAQKASISPKNLKDLYKINRELFGLDRIKSLASAVAMDKMVGVMAKRANITKTEMYGRLKFEKANEQDLPQGVKLQVDAWHGSPYQFDKFTAKKIGTGEGAQAFGWGLYFTDLEGIAREYADKLTEHSVYINGTEVTSLKGTPLYDVSLFIFGSNNIAKEQGKQSAIANLKQAIRDNRIDYNEAKKAIEYLEGLESFSLKKDKRNLYKVSLHKGKTPDQYTWLEWDKPLTEQQIDLIVEHGNNEFGDVFSKEKDGDVFYLGIKRPNGRISQSNLGESVYKNIIQYQTNSQKEASLFLLRAGIDGIKYPAESIARGATSGTARGFNYVVFDENAVSIEEVIKFQKDANKARGAAMVSMDGQSVIYALTDPNVSTPLHEMAHVFEHYMTDAEKAIVHTWAGTKGWTTQTSEKFARGFEKYLAEGKAPTPALQKIFDKFKQWLTDIYNGIVGSDIDIELNDKMRDIYSQMLGAKAVEDVLGTPPTANKPIKEAKEDWSKDVESTAKALEKAGKDKTISGDNIWDNAKKSGSENNDFIENMEEYESQIKGNQYLKVPISIDLLRKNDKDLNEYLEDINISSSKREIKTPIIIGDADRGAFETTKDGVIDGFHRIEQAIINGDKNIMSFIPLKSKLLSEAYHKAKADGSNPELVAAVEELLGNQSSQKQVASAVQSKSKSNEQKQRRSRKNRRGLDPVPEGGRQGILFGAEAERHPDSGGDSQGDVVLGQDRRIGGDGTVSAIGSDGSGESRVVPEKVPDVAPATGPTNFTFKTPLDPAHAATTFNVRSRFEDNLAALRLLIDLIKNDRHATPAEQDVLARYVGWGGIKVVLMPDDQAWSESDEKLRPLVAELKAVISELEALGVDSNILSKIKGSVLNAHYTSIPIIRSVYGILSRLGFNGGRVLEPSAGIGNFLGAMPGAMAQNSAFNAVELEPLSGAILKKLYPKSHTTIAGYETARFPRNHFDLVVSNVPFGNYRIATDKDDSLILKKAAAQIHNYFLVRALEQTREGGIVAIITSAGTMDAKANKYVREYVNENADFLGAIRLPASAFKGNAGTEVVTDILFLRKNSSGPKSNPSFLESAQIHTQHKNSGKPITISVNEYFANNPDHVLGEFKAGGLYSETDMTVEARPNQNTAQLIQDLAQSFPENVFVPAQSQPVIDTDIEGSEVGDNHYYISGDGKPKIKKDGVETDVPKTHLKKIAPLIKLRDLLMRQYQLEMYSDSEAEIEANRAELAKAYHDWVRRFGPINAQANKSTILRDEFGYNILGIENWDKDTKTASAADILSKRQINRARTVDFANSIEDAIAISVNETGTVNLGRLAQLLRQDIDIVFEQGYGLFFRDHNGDIVSRSEYLSGNVKAKLKEAKRLAELDPLYEKNVEALSEVIPEDIPYPAIEVNIGARWIPTEVYKNFLQFLLNTRDVSVSYSKATDTYKASGLKTPEAEKLYGTARMSAYQIMEAAMQGRTPIIRDEDPETKKSHVNEIETQAVADKLSAITQAFEDWVWTDGERATELAAIYNDKFNTSVRRSYDGNKVSIEGMKSFNLRPHQEAAISMITLNNGGIVDHIVGAGKTAVMIGAAMKLKQTGTANKPAIIALKSTIPDIVAEAKKLFPLARILAPTATDFSAKNRKALLSRIQNNDWDLVIMSHDQFKFIPQDPEYETGVIQEELALIEKEMIQLQGETGSASKQQLKGLETRKKNLEVKLQELKHKGSKDKELLNFKEIGIDHIFVDESQQFKNLPYATKITRVAGLGDPSGSSRAFNLLIAIRTLQALHGGDKGATFLSGTPISNSLVEMYLLLKYMRPQKMAELGYDTFDAWVKNAAKQSSEIEFSVTGSVAAKTRFRTFINIPEMAMLYSEIADVRNDNNLSLPKPKIRGGGPELITVKQSPEQEAMTARLMEFASQPHGQRDGSLIGKPNMSEAEQNAAMLLATNISTKVAVDLRLVNPRAEFNPEGKLAAVANQVFTEYVASSPGLGTQLIFSDIGTPKTGDVVEDVKSYLQDEKGVIDDDLALIFGTEANPKKLTQAQLRELLETELEYDPASIDQIFAEAKLMSQTSFNVYDEIKRLLIAKGIPANEIAFIHSYNTEKAKSELFADVNAGKIRVLIGSTQKLGTGVNVQKRIVAMHHVDASWNPAAMAQRNGRGIRQGNINDEVAIYNYGTERTLDAYKYQLIGTKQRFIDQVKNAATSDRVYREDDGEDMTAQEFVALLSGDPTLLEKAKTDAVVEKLKRAKKSFDAEQFSVGNKIAETRVKIATFEAVVSDREADIKTVNSQSETDAEGKLIPSETISGITPKDSKERTQLMDAISKRMKSAVAGTEEVVGRVSGLDLVAKTVEIADNIGMFAGTKQVKFYLAGKRQYNTSPSSFSPAINKLAEDLVKVKDTLKTLREQLQKYEGLKGQVWPKSQELEEAIAKQKQLDAVLQQQAQAQKVNYPTQEDGETPIVREAEVVVGQDQKELVQFQSVAPDQNYPGAEPTENIRSFERVWTEDKSFNFTGRLRVRNAADVANIMRVLEDKSVEHAFAVHVDAEGIAHIQHLGVGNSSAVVVDIPGLIAGAKRFKAKKTYFVHNHPSGEVDPSFEDKKLVTILGNALNELGIEGEYLIMDTYNETYAVFDRLGHEKYSRGKSSSGHKHKTHKGNSFKALTKPLSSTISSSRDVFQFIYGQRFGATPKTGVLILDRRNRIIGNYLFKTGEIVPSEMLTEFVSHPTASSMILYGNRPMPKNITALTAPFAGFAKVLDYVHVVTPGQDRLGAYNSATDEGLAVMAEIQAKYGTNTVQDSAPVTKTVLNRGQMQRLLARLQRAIPADIFSDTSTLNEKLKEFGIDATAFLFGSENNPNLSETNAAAFKKARRMKIDGQNNADIKKETGWFTGIDGKWKYIIDDSRARFTVPVSELKKLSTGKIPDYTKAIDFNQVFSHPELEKEYPDLIKNTKFVLYESSNTNEYGYIRNLKGSSERTIVINITGSRGEDIGRRVLGTTLHELQHGIQGATKPDSNFKAGGIQRQIVLEKLKSAQNGGRGITLYDTKHTKLDLTKADDQFIEDLSWALYESHYEEIEARAAANNNDLGGEIQKLVDDFYWVTDIEPSQNAVIKLQSVDGLQFMRDAANTIYGATFPDGSIYLNPEHVIAETPVHEYGHLWVRALKHNDPAQYERIYHRARHDKPALASVQNDPAYAHLKTQAAVIDEVLARFIGDAGARQYLREQGLSQRELNWRRQVYDVIIEAMSRLRTALGLENVSDIADMAASRLLAGRQLFDQDQLPFSNTTPHISFSMAESAAAGGNPDAVADAVARIKAEGGSLEHRLRRYAGVWLDVVEPHNAGFIKRGLQLIADTPYLAEAGGDARTALANAIADRTRKAPKLLDWVKQFWKKVGNVLRLNIEPDKLAELSLNEWLDIAAIQLRYSNELYNHLSLPVPDTVSEQEQAKPVSEQEQAKPVSEQEQAKPTPPRPRPAYPAKKTQADLDNDYDDLIADYKPQPRPSPRMEQATVSAKTQAKIENRDKSAKTQGIAHHISPRLQELLRNYAVSPTKKRVIETLKLLMPTLSGAGITVYVHETADAYYNAVLGSGGTNTQAANSHGFYKDKAIHIALFRPDLKANTALHEAFHPLIREILVSQRHIFNRFIADIVNDPELRRRYWDGFALSHYAGQDLPTQQEEAIVEATADIVLARILRDLDAMPDTLWNRILTYIKDALDDTYGTLYQFVNTRDGFKAFAEDLANAIAKGQVVPMTPEIKSGLRTTIAGGIRFSLSEPVSLLSSLINSDNSLNYEQIKSVSDRIWETGSAQIIRLNSEEERGRLKAGKRNAEISLVIAASFRANPTQQSQGLGDAATDRGTNAEPERKPGQGLTGLILPDDANSPVLAPGEVPWYDQPVLETLNVHDQNVINYAKANGLWAEEADLIDAYPVQMPSGAESKVYLNGLGTAVIKITNPYVLSPDLQAFVDNHISLQNFFFDDTAYELLGITQDQVSGGIRFVLKQNFIHGTELEKLGDESAQKARVDEFMLNNFGMMPHRNHSYYNDRYVIQDVHLRNVFEGSDGHLYFIDTAPRLNTDVKTRFGPPPGTASYLDFDVVDTEPSFSMADDDKKSLRSRPDLLSLSDEKGKINHEALEALTDAVLDGSAAIDRLPLGAEQGRRRGGKTAVAASLLLGASNKTSRGRREGNSRQERIAAQEALLRQYADDKNLWIKESDVAQTSPKKLPSGVKSDVYVSADGQYVTKFVKYRVLDNTPESFLDNRIGLYNFLAPESHYELIGFSKDNDGFRFVVKQPYIEGRNLDTNDAGDASLLHMEMQKRGFSVHSPYTFASRDFVLYDVKNGNVKITPEGRLIFIDVVPKLNTENRIEYGSGNIINGPAFSMADNDVSAQASLRLRQNLLAYPELDHEPSAAKLVAAGLLTQAEADDIMWGWRQARARGLSRDASIEAIMDMEELLHLRNKDEADNGQIKNEILREIFEAESANVDLGDLSKRYSPRRVRDMVEEVAASGLAHPITVLDNLQKLNRDTTNEPVGGPKLTVAVQIAMTELKAAEEHYQSVFDRTGDIVAAQQLSAIADIRGRIAWEAKIQGSRAGSALGIRAQLMELAGLSYESVIENLERLTASKAGTGTPVSDADKSEIKRLVNEVTRLEKALQEAQISGLDKKKAAAQKEWHRKTRSGLESRPRLTKSEAIEQLRRLRARTASFSMALSADPDPEFNYFEIVNELVKIVHSEGASGFKDVVDKVRDIDSGITEDDIYNAILSTTPLAKQQALSEYATRQAHTRRHVKAIAKLERMINEDVTNLLRKQKVPDDTRINEFGKLLKEIEQNIYRVDPEGRLFSQWLNALERIRTDYGLAFLTPEPETDTETLLSRIINSARLLADQKTRDWLEQENKRLDQAIAKVNAGDVSDLVSQEDNSYIEYPKTMTVPVFDSEGNVIGTRIEPFDFGRMDRLIQDKRRELEKIKAKYRKKKKYVQFWNKLRGTLGSNLAMADLSYFAIQSFKMMVTTDPRKSLPVFWRSLKAMRDEFRKNPGYANNVHREIMESLYYELAINSGLAITAPDAHVFINEMMSNDDWFDDLKDWTRKKTGTAAKIADSALTFREKVKLASNAAFATHLNLLAIQSFSEYVERTQRLTGQMPTHRELEVIAQAINNSLGRSSNLQGATKAAAHVFWAPKLYLSQIMNVGTIVTDPAKLLYYAVKPGENSDLVRAYGHRTVKSLTFAAMTVGLYLLRKQLAKWQCKDEIEASTNIHSRGFGKIRCGELTFNPTGNHAQWIFRGYQYLMAGTSNPETGFGGRKMLVWDIAQEHMEYKMTPPFAAVINFWQGTNFLGQQRHAGDTSPLHIKSSAKVAMDYAKPIFLGGIPDIIVAEGPTAVSKPFLIIEALLGSGMTYISADEKKKRAEIEKAVRIEASTKAKSAWLEQYPQFARHVQGDFKNQKLSWKDIQPTDKTKTIDGVAHPIFKNVAALGDDDPRNDFVVIRTHKTGANKGLKYFDWKVLQKK